MDTVTALQPATSTSPATVIATVKAAVSAEAARNPGDNAKASDANPAPAISLQQLRRMKLDVRFDNDSHDVVVSITDPASGAVIYQVPSEMALDIAKHLDARERILDQKA